MLAWRPAVRHGQADPPVRLAGLDPSARYQDPSTGTTYDGAVLMAYGLEPAFPKGDYASTLIHLRTVP
ncbi:GH36 C-terminal domain-containing protein [Phytohabitans rumicis]|uniref:GH36 C-terminal domain-containing protein n=1 Tax=Phytohabitans rumicis TaxID=1076125 RepID=UPI001FEA06CE|nr:GH36 C-terminal domain-containing protein [Phytohabitans rumicis]